MTSTLAWIRQHYNVPAFRGVEVIYHGKSAVIVGGKGPWVRLRVEGQRRLIVNHPTYETTYPTLPLPARPRGWCKFCMTERALLKNGTVAAHHRHEAKRFGPEERRCPGAGKQPWAVCSWTVPAKGGAA